MENTSQNTSNVSPESWKEFENYKKAITADDCKKMESFKLSWYDFIPVIGWFIFSIKFSFAVSKVDRGNLRYNINRWTLVPGMTTALLSTIFLCVASTLFEFNMIYTIVFTVLAVLVLTSMPFFISRGIKKAIQKTKEKIDL